MLPEQPDLGPKVYVDPVVDMPEAARRLKCSRSKLYRLINEGKVQSVRSGGQRFVVAASIDEYWRRLIDEQARTGDENKNTT